MANPVGRPPWVPTEKTLEEVESYAALGLTQQQIADCLGIHIATLCEKKNEFVEFDEAIKRGQSKGVARVANLLTKSAEAGNVPAQIFYLKARAKWSDQNIEEVQKAIKDELDEVKKMVQECMKDQN